MELSPDTQRILLRKESKNIPDIGNGKHGAFILTEQVTHELGRHGPGVSGW